MAKPQVFVVSTERRIASNSDGNAAKVSWKGKPTAQSDSVMGMGKQTITEDEAIRVLGLKYANGVAF